MEPTLSEALVAIFGEDAAPGATTTTVPTTPSTTAPPSTSTTSTTGTTVPSGPTTTLSGDAQALIEQANQLYQAALEAQQRGDWAEYGRQIEELGTVLEALEALQR